MTNCDVFANDVSRCLDIFFKVASELNHLVSNAFLHLSMMSNQFVDLSIVINSFVAGLPMTCCGTALCTHSNANISQLRLLSPIHTTDADVIQPSSCVSGVNRIRN